MKTVTFAAVDLGAESGRVMRVGFDGARFQLEAVHRFPNGPVRVGETLHWDAPKLFAEIQKGLRLCARESGLAGIGVDTWGVDFGLLGERDELLENPVHYRDRRTDGMMDEVFRVVPREEVFERTGIQFMQLNTLYQMVSLLRRRPQFLAQARTLLTMPDLLNFWLTGRKVGEFTIATTTQMYDQRAGDWARPMLDRLGLPTRILPQIVKPGAILGPLLPLVAEETGIKGAPVIAPACHDTGSAVAAAPLSSPHSAYISSGTWSLAGVEVPAPVITPMTYAGGFTNEGGVNGTVRLLRNIGGLWLLQECRRTWAEEGTEYSYDDLTRLAAAAPALAAFVDPDDADFGPPGDMPARLRRYCARTKQAAPESHAALARCILESLALRYRLTVEKLEAALGWKVDRIHIIGGGSKNALLCQMTADVTGLPVLAGPVEATALGNALIQAQATGHLASVAEGREAVKRSFTPIAYDPHPSEAWEAAYQRFMRLV